MSGFVVEISELLIAITNSLISTSDFVIFLTNGQKNRSLMVRVRISRIVVFSFGRNVAVLGCVKCLNDCYVVICCEYFDFSIDNCTFAANIDRNEKENLRRVGRMEREVGQDAIDRGRCAAGGEKLYSQRVWEPRV
jgi:hypothetical protein